MVPSNLNNKYILYSHRPFIQNVQNLMCCTIMIKSILIALARTISFRITKGKTRFQNMSIYHCDVQRLIIEQNVGIDREIIC